MTEDTPDDIKFLPLQTNETRKLQMAPAWIPTPEEIKTFLQSLILTADLIVILVILIIDYYLHAAGRCHLLRIHHALQ